MSFVFFLKNRNFPKAQIIIACSIAIQARVERRVVSARKSARQLWSVLMLAFFRVIQSLFRIRFAWFQFRSRAIVH